MFKLVVCALLAILIIEAQAMRADIHKIASFIPHIELTP